MNENEIIFPLVVGITSSLAATAIFLSLAEIFRRVVFPWVEDKLYRGARIDGEWIGTSEVTGSKLKLTQWGDKVKGTFTHGEGKDMSVYSVTGVIKNMYFMATMEPISNKLIDALVLLMHLDAGDHSIVLTGALLVKTGTGNVRAEENLTFIQKNNE